MYRSMEEASEAPYRNEQIDKHAIPNCYYHGTTVMLFMFALPPVLFLATGETKKIHTRAEFRSEFIGVLLSLPHS